MYCCTCFYVDENRKRIADDTIPAVTISKKNMSVFTSIGSKGTAIPHELRRLEESLKIGRNIIEWATPHYGHDPLGIKACAWVSENRKPFELYSLRRAVREGRVQPIRGLRWRAK